MTEQEIEEVRAHLDSVESNVYGGPGGPLSDITQLLIHQNQLLDHIDSLNRQLDERMSLLGRHEAMLRSSVATERELRRELSALRNTHRLNDVIAERLPELVERKNELESIVRELARFSTIMNGSEWGEPYCVTCNGTRPGGLRPNPPFEHNPDCPYRRAVDWVGKNP